VDSLLCLAGRITRV